MPSDLASYRRVETVLFLSRCNLYGTNGQLSDAWKLATSLGLERIFISPDEPLEVRRQKTMDRLKKKTLGEGKEVSVVSGVLFIDNECVFSPEKGSYQRTDG